MDNKKRFADVACTLAVIGSFTPWVTAQTIFGKLSATGTDGGDGWATVLLAVAAALLISYGKRQMFIWAAIVSFVGLIICINDVGNVIDKNVNGVPVTVGYGLWICILGFVAVFVLAILLRIDASEKKTTWAPPTVNW